MSENTMTTETVETEQAPQTEIEAPEGDATEAEGVTETTEAEGKGKEAAKYRRRLRETESERDQLNTQLETTRTSLLEAQLSGTGVTAEAILAAGHTIADLLDDDGNLDPAKVQKASGTAAEKFNIRRPAPYSSALGRTNQAEVSGGTWADALKG